MATTTDFERSIKAGQILPGMSFNEKVWALTARIPPGEVRTYGWIARELGTRGYRAVGNALNRNPYAPAVPCHRVVGSNGGLTGFAGGLEKKQALLLGEGVMVRNGKAAVSRDDADRVAKHPRRGTAGRASRALSAAPDLFANQR